MRGAAVISTDGLYRYSLDRLWGEGERRAVFIMLNPSTADASEDDPTIRRCIGFAKREGCDGLTVVNLYAYRATRPADLWKADDPVGPVNDWHIDLALQHAAVTQGPVIAAWGAHASPHRAYRVKQMPGMADAHALAFTKSGAPGHPLYIKGDAPLLPLTPPPPPEALMSDDRETLARIETEVMEIIDPDGYGWASGDAPSVREVIDAILASQWLADRDAATGERIAREIQSACPPHITRDYTPVDAAYDNAARIARTQTGDTA